MGAIDRLSEAIAYPVEELKRSTSAAEFLVDGGVVRAEEGRGKLRFVRKLGATAGSGLAHLAGFAAGRMLKEAAVLAWDPQTKGLVLWQEVPTSGSDESLLREFDLFLDSCDWWESRMKELADRGGKPIAEMVILP